MTPRDKFNLAAIILVSASLVGLKSFNSGEPEADTSEGSIQQSSAVPSHQLRPLPSAFNSSSEDMGAAADMRIGLRSDEQEIQRIPADALAPYLRMHYQATGQYLKLMELE